MLNIIAVVSSIGDNIVGNKTRKHLTLIDDSNLSIQMTLWGDDLCTKADQFHLGEIVAFNDVGVSKFGGKSLNASNRCKIMREFKHVRCSELEKWYAVKDKSQINSLTEQQGGRKENKNSNTELNLVSEIELIAEQSAYGSDSDQFFVFNGYISRVKSDSAFIYPACTMEGCKRKVIEEGSNVWRCEACNVSKSEFKPTYMFNA